MSRDSYCQRLAERLDEIAPGVREGLRDAWDLPEETAKALLRELLETGCLSQHCANIQAAREEILRLPPDWVAFYLPKAAPVCLFQEPEWREWEFRRAAELLEGSFSEALAWLTEYGAGLKDPEVDEAIEDLADKKETGDASIP